ncbi:MAG: type III-B CRISPR module RAMP protein Cmr1, partial [Methylococcales bacterium]
MNEITATYRIVTPMFIGNADQTTDDRIRPPSVKGALRFWWRALNWGRFRSADADALRELHKEEARLFGIAADEERGGEQGCFLLKVSHKSPENTPKGTVHSNFRTNDTACYLRYGLMVAFGRTDSATRSGRSSYAVTAITPTGRIIYD